MRKAVQKSRVEKSIIFSTNPKDVFLGIEEDKKTTAAPDPTEGSCVFGWELKKRYRKGW